MKLSRNVNKVVILFVALASITLSGAISRASPCSSGNGFGADNIFDSLIAPSLLIARNACPQLGIRTGDFVELSAQESSFAILTFETNRSLLSLNVPADADYVFSGSCPSRTSNEIRSSNGALRVTMDPQTAKFIRIETAASKISCVFERCPGYGLCN